jgi:hypothetical protein
MKCLRFSLLICLYIFLSGCGKSGLADAIDPESGSFTKFKTWKAENGKFEVYGVDIKYIDVRKSEDSDKLDWVGMDTKSSAKLSEIQNATAKLCHASSGKLQNTENSIVYFGEVRNKIGGISYKCMYMKRHSDGVGSISIHMNPKS